MDEELFYKVVYRDPEDGLLKSAIVYDAPFAVVYKPGEVVSSQCGPCMIYRDRNDTSWAEEHTTHGHEWWGSYLEVWTCRVENPRRCSQMLPPSSCYLSETVRMFWENERRCALGDPLPKVWLADSVELVEKIYPLEESEEG